ncbi:hypothetical protein [Microcoleus sp. LEGE 07076]|nr:hypothetical protein [Microcoleus sp. LEGE 07076]
MTKFLMKLNLMMAAKESTPGRTHTKETEFFTECAGCNEIFL